MRGLCASLFRLFFRIPGNKRHFFGLYQKVFVRYDLFRGVVKNARRLDLDLSLQVDEWIQASLYFTGTYENEELELVRSLLKPEDVFVDLGANIGLYSMIASRAVGPKGHVYSFEPFPLNTERLKQHLATNQCSNATVIQKAVADKSGSLTLKYDHSSQNTGMPSAYNTYGTEVQVKVVALDEEAKDQKWNRVDFIKMDIEGGEYLALLGMRQILETWVPKILLELHPQAVARTPYTANQIIEILTERNYTGRQIGGGFNYLFQVNKSI